VTLIGCWAIAFSGPGGWSVSNIDPFRRALLFDDAHNHIADGEAIITIVGDPKLGKVSVIAPSVMTATIAGELHNDALRLIIAGDTGTLLLGLVSAITDAVGVPPNCNLFRACA
jgi:hypothetical protein